MGFFRNNTKRILEEFKHKSEDFSKDLGKEIRESLDDLKSEYDENSHVVDEFIEFAQQLKNKLDSNEAERLEDFSARLKKISRVAKNGVEAMRELSLNQRKLTTETLRLYEDFEY